ncbi:MAG TPA: hypothetical protein VHJ40_00350 [Actinomycetota bacterium]|nr:hypothetical protein [Actinomycetota bacterium]
MEDQESAAPEEAAQEEAAGSAGQGSAVDAAMSQIPGLAESLQSQSAARQAGRAQNQGGGLPAGDEQMDDSVDEAMEQMPELREDSGGPNQA